MKKSVARKGAAPSGLRRPSTTRGEDTRLGGVPATLPHCATCACKPFVPGRHSEACVRRHAEWSAAWSRFDGQTTAEVITAAHAAKVASDSCLACKAGDAPGRS